MPSNPLRHVGVLGQFYCHRVAPSARCGRSARARYGQAYEPVSEYESYVWRFWVVNGHSLPRSGRFNALSVSFAELVAEVSRGPWVVAVSQQGRRADRVGAELGPEGVHCPVCGSA